MSARIVIEELEEALAFYGPHEAYEGFELAILNAAHRVVSGTPILWCDTHRESVPDSGVERRCWASRRLSSRRPCRIVDRILIDPKEET